MWGALAFFSGKWLCSEINLVSYRKSFNTALLPATLFQLICVLLYIVLSGVLIYSAARVFNKLTYLLTYLLANTNLESDMQ